MTKANLLGGALVGAAMAVAGCGTAGTSASPAALDQSVVPASIDGRTDLFLDPVLSRHLLTADEVNGSPTAVAVAVQITQTELIAWRANVPVTSRTAADIVGHFQIVGMVDLRTARAIDDATHREDPGAVIPPGVIGGFTGNTGHEGPSVLPRLSEGPELGIQINWNIGDIPNSVDVETYRSIVNAHPGCA